MSQTDPLLFDTQALIFWAMDAAPRGVVSRVQAGANVSVSIVSFWEFLLKTRYHGIGLSFTELQAAVAALRATLIGIELQHLETLQKLPLIDNHKDPFDRLIISQAISEQFVLVGKDREFSKYCNTALGADLTILWD